MQKSSAELSQKAAAFAAQREMNTTKITKTNNKKTNNKK